MGRTRFGFHQHKVKPWGIKNEEKIPGLGVTSLCSDSFTRPSSLAETLKGRPVFPQMLIFNLRVRGEPQPGQV